MDENIKEDLKSSVTGQKWKLAEPQNRFENAPEINENLDPELDYAMKTINRGPLGIPTHALKAAAFHYATECGEINDEFMLCKNEEMDPRNCLKYNNKVSDCARDFYFKVTEACQESYVALAQCMERDHGRGFRWCRKPQLEFDKCMLDKLGLDKVRTPMVYDRKVKTDRPKPFNPLGADPIVLDRMHPDLSRKF